MAKKTSKKEEKVEEQPQEDVQKEIPQEEPEKEPKEELQEENQEQTQLPKFWKTFYGDKPYDPALKDEYLQKVEDNYTRSWEEGVRLANENKSLKQSKPEPSQDLISQLPVEYQVVLDRLAQKDSREYTEAWVNFARNNPELATEINQQGIQEISSTIARHNPSLSWGDVFEKTAGVMKNPAIAQKVQSQQPTQPQPTQAQQSFAQQGVSQGSMPQSSPPIEKKEQLSSEEKTIAEKFNMTEEEYLEGKKQSAQK